MQEKDIAAKEFFNRPVIVADLCNSFFFGGERVVEPEGVTPLGTEMTAGPLEDGGEAGEGTSARRMDSFFRISYKMPRRRKLEVFYFHMEFQSRGGRNMVIRSEEYEGRGNALIVIEASRKPGGVIFPVLSLTVSLTGRPWKSPVSLRERFRKMDPRLLAHLSYQMNVFDPFTLDEKIIDGMSPELKVVVNCLRHSRDQEKLAQILEEIPDGVMTRAGVRFLAVYMKLGLTIPEKEEKIEMCKAVKDWKRMLVNEGREMGRAEGRAEGLSEGRAEERADIILNMLRRNVLPQQIHQMTGLSLKQILEIAAAKPAGV